MGDVMKRSTLAAILGSVVLAPAPAYSQGTHADVVRLYDELQELREPELVDGVPDLSPEAIEKQKRGLEALRRELNTIEPRAWPVPQQVDYLLVRTKMDELDFHHRVIKPWARDPGFYLDSIAQIPFAEVPLDSGEASELERRLRSVPAVLEQAKSYLTEGARDLLVVALRNLKESRRVGGGQPMRNDPPPGVVGWYQDLVERLPDQHSDLVPVAKEALAAVEGYRDWLEENREQMTAPGGIGLDNYDWFLKHARLMPFTAADVRALGEREEQRGWAFLKIEQNQNRDLPELELAKTREEYIGRVREADVHIRAFIRTEGILTIPDFIGELDRHVPWVERPTDYLRFWEQLQYRDPRTDHVHATIPGHQFDGRIQARDERPIRAGYRDGARGEGWGFYLEEMMLQAGLLDERPRARELYYIAQLGRAVRIASELMMHAREGSIEEAVRYMLEHTPWMDEHIAWFDCEVYLRRPTYGIGYTIGAVQIQQLFSDRARQLGDAFDLREFHDAILGAGRIPISMTRWEMTGLDDEGSRFFDDSGGQ